MVDELRRQSRPYVFISVESRPVYTVLVLRNTGVRVAVNVRLRVEKDAYVWELKKDERRFLFSSLPIAENGVASLAPGENLVLGGVDS